MDYDAWKTDPEYGLTHADLLDREKREDMVDEKAGRAEKLRGEIAPLLQKLRGLLGELGQMNAHGPAYEYTTPALPDLPEPYCHPRTVTGSQCPEELWNHVDEWLCSDWSRESDLDRQTFKDECDDL